MNMKKIIEILVTAAVAVGFTFIPIHPFQRQYKLQYTPDLRSYVTSWNIHVGKSEEYVLEGKKYVREDNIIAIPLSVCNKSYGLSKDIGLTILYHDGSKGNEIIHEIPVLEGGQQLDLPVFAPSILANAQKIYLSGEKTFKMKVLLCWRDASRREYGSVELFKLCVTEAYSDAPSRFIFVSEGFYNSIESPKKFKEHSVKKIDF